MLDGPLLIANRGEIAVRVAHTARRLGLSTVAVFSDADDGAAHIDAADTAVRIGGPGATASYLNIDALLGAAAQTGARAVHPGYGFLSENPDFAQAVSDGGMTWVGPPPAAIELMGDKARAKLVAAAAGVPVIEGLQGDALSAEEIDAFCAEQGLPVVIKAVGGGGGKGMRVVRERSEVADALAIARRETVAAFGDARVLVERYLERPRHVEIQVLADRHGACVHLGERECSLQRRHQKVIEEAPAPGLDEAQRASMGAAAVSLALAAGYEGAGTIEFIVPADASGFFFLEMNTRLQVEHPVTELVYGVDLVEHQLRVAAGEPLGLRQADLHPSGHAIEARLYAEDARTGFLPSTGRIVHWREPRSAHVRIDTGVRTGSEVTGHYDPMLAKVIAHAPDRPAALRRLDRALADLEVLGVTTNAAFSRALLRDPEVQAGRLDTGMIERGLEMLVTPAPEDLLPAAALAIWLQDTASLTSAPGPWQRTFAGHGDIVIRDGRVHVAARSWAAAARRVEDGIRVELDGISRRYAAVVDDRGVWIARDGHQLTAALESRRRGAAAVGDDSLEAPMPGTVLLVHVGDGDDVGAGDVLVVLESMKMELTIVAPHDGVVRDLTLVPGDRVTLGQRLATIAPREDG